jgi:hypothetical protein
MSRVLWHKKTTTVERQVSTSERHLSMSLRVDEVTAWAVAGASPATPTESCAELELGAHVAGMRALSPRAPAARLDRSPLSEALVPG